MSDDGVGDDLRTETEEENDSRPRREVHLYTTGGVWIPISPLSGLQTVPEDTRSVN